MFGIDIIFNAVRLDIYYGLDTKRIGYVFLSSFVVASFYSRPKPRYTCQRLIRFQGIWYLDQRFGIGGYAIALAYIWDEL